MHRSGHHAPDLLDGAGSRVDRHTLPPTRDAPARARSALRSALRGDARFDAAALGLSELVTNAVVHGCRAGAAEEPIELRIATCADGVAVAVRDPGAGFAVPDHARDGRPAEGGWGLEIVAAIAADWGVERHDDGTVVWFAV